MCAWQCTFLQVWTNNYLFLFSRKKNPSRNLPLIQSIFQAVYDTTPLFWANLVDVSLQDVMSQLQHLLSVQFSFLPAEPECHEGVTTPGEKKEKKKKKEKTWIIPSLLFLLSLFFSISQSYTWGHRETCHPDLPLSTSTTPWKRHGLASCSHHFSATEKETAAPGGA